MSHDPGRGGCRARVISLVVLWNRAHSVI